MAILTTISYKTRSGGEYSALHNLIVNKPITFDALLAAYGYSAPIREFDSFTGILVLHVSMIDRDTIDNGDIFQLGMIIGRAAILADS